MATIYTQGVYAVVKTQKSSLPSWIITCGNVKNEKNCINGESWEAMWTYLGIREGLSEETGTW